MKDITTDPHHSDENRDQPSIPLNDDPLLNKIKNYILDTYEPVSDPAEADLMMSTTEIFEAIGRLYRNEVMFSKDMLASWMHEKGFTFIDTGKMRFEWLLKSASK